MSEYYTKAQIDAIATEIGARIKSRTAGTDAVTGTLGNNSDVEFFVNHNLGSTSPLVTVWVDNDNLDPDIRAMTANQTRFRFASAPDTDAVEYRISLGGQGPKGDKGDPGGSSALPLFKAKTDQIGTSLANTTVVLTWGAATKKDSPFAHVDGSSDITINDAGWYEFVARVQAQNDNRMELILQLHVDTTGGGFVADPDEIISDYIARDTDQDTGGLALPIQYEFSAGDVFRIVATGDADGTSSILAGTQIFGKKVA